MTAFNQTPKRPCNLSETWAQVCCMQRNATRRERNDTARVAFCHSCGSAAALIAFLFMRIFPPVKSLLPGVFLCPVMTASPVTGCSQVVLFASSLLGEKKKRGKRRWKKQPTKGIRVEPSPNFPSRWYLLDKEDASVAGHAVTPRGRQARQPLRVEVRRHVWALRAALELRASDLLARTRHSLATASRAQAGDAPLGAGRTHRPMTWRADAVYLFRI